jgi:hypothetical protein
MSGNGWSRCSGGQPNGEEQLLYRCSSDTENPDMRVALLLIASSVLGAVVGVMTMATSAMNVICDFERPVTVDRCSGTYIAIHGEHRLPQFMQGSHADQWLVASAAILGLLVADLLVLAGKWVWSRVRTHRIKTLAGA